MGRREPAVQAFNILPSGDSYPFDFGFIPSTEADDGDPLDVLLLMEEPDFTGCLVPSRLIGVIKAEEDGTRNDRLVAVADQGELYKSFNSLCDLPDQYMHQIEDFFISYHQRQGKKFKIIDTKGPKPAHEIVVKAQSSGGKGKQ